MKKNVESHENQDKNDIWIFNGNRNDDCFSNFIISRS